MNKKLLTALCVCSILLAVLLITVVVMGSRDEKPVTDPTGTEAQISANAGTEAIEQTGAVSTEPSDDTLPTDPSAPEDSVPTMPEETQKEPTTPAEPTIPPENVDMGTEEDKEATGNLGDDSSGNTSTSPTQGKDPEPTTPPTEAPDSTGSILGEDFDISELTYEEFMAMSGEQQRAVIDLFGSPEDFMVWFKAVEAIYKAEHPDIEIGGDGTVNP